jgi:class 3 adenylate cyclase
LIAKIGYRRLHKQFSELFKKIENAHEKGRSAIQAYAKMTPVSAHLSATAQFKFEEFSKKLKIKKFATSLVDRFIKHIKTAADLDLNKIRIIALAREWQVDENDLLVLAMHATREGLLRLSWELVCPHCRSTRETSERLEDIRKAGHCDVCEVDFSSQDPNAVEINFRVQPSVRVVTEAVFCAAEAAKKDHIKVQLPLKPGESWKGSVHLAPGLYRLRWVGEKNQYVFQLDPKGLKEGTIEWDGSSNFVGHEESYNQVTFEIANSFQQTRLFVLEQMWWAKDLLTPGKVFSLQEFRDLFTEETLGIGTVLDVGEQAILFTDIVGSTEFYETTGDSFAFSAVSKHFDELFKVIREHKGAVIKTVGDAVMGAFNDPSDALKASFAMQNIFVKNQKDLSGIRIRVSAHTGPVLAVRLNSPIDYFGATVNYAAKLQALCGAHEIAFSEKLYETYKALFKDEAVNAEMKSIQISTRKKTIQGYVFNMKA